MDVPSGESLWTEQRGLEELSEKRFWQWVNQNEDPELFAAFDNAIRVLYLLKRVTIEQQPHVDYELTFALERVVSHAFAVLALLEKGFVAEACSILRTIGEGCDLMLLLTTDEDEPQSFLSSNEDQRDANYRASKLRAKLADLIQSNLLDKLVYRAISRRFSHFSTGSVSLNSNASEIEVMGAEFHKSNVIMAIGFWAGSILIAMRLGLQLIDYKPEDDSVSIIGKELAIAIEALSARL